MKKETTSIRRLYPNEEICYRNMVQRCNNPNAMGYEHYGGRGIKVCERWLSNFYNFLEDMGPRPSKEHTLDRYPDVNGNYGPENCRWATREEQANNKRDNTLLTYNNTTKTIHHWAKELGIKENTITYRVKRGWPIGEVLGFEKRKPAKRVHNRIEAPYRGRLTDEQIKEIIQLRKQGFTIIKLGQMYNIDNSSISRIMSRYSVKPEVNKKENFHQEVYQYYLSGYTVSQIARDKNMAQSTVHYIVDKYRKAETKEYKKSKKAA